MSARVSQGFEESCALFTMALCTVILVRFFYLAFWLTILVLCNGLIAGVFVPAVVLQHKKLFQHSRNGIALSLRDGANLPAGFLYVGRNWLFLPVIPTQ